MIAIRALVFALAAFAGMYTLCVAHCSSLPTRTSPPFPYICPISSLVTASTDHRSWHCRSGCSRCPRPSQAYHPPRRGCRCVSPRRHLCPTPNSLHWRGCHVWLRYHADLPVLPCRGPDRHPRHSDQGDDHHPHCHSHRHQGRPYRRVSCYVCTCINNHFVPEY
jgi:hypothetical protein